MAVRYKRFLSAALGLGLAVLATASAEADARLCRRLQAELASLPQSRGIDRSLYQRYDQAVAEQKQELSIARQRARAMECGFSPGPADDQCQSIGIKIERMELNLTDLQRKRSVLARGTVGNSGERSRLEAALQENGCEVDASGQRTASSGGADEGGLFDQLNRSSIEYTIPNDENVLRVPDGEGDYSVRAYRTICVRTCDGYYFPMSPSSSRDDFARDQQNCESICPGAEMRTYYQRSGEQDIDSMMSTRSEQPYSELATAYLYRRTDTELPACGCEQAAAQQHYSVIAGEGSAAAESENPVIPHPWPRPDKAADPETLANTEGGLGSAEIKELLKPRTAEKQAPPGERKIRVVGPAFLPDPAAAADPPVPDPNVVR